MLRQLPSPCSAKIMTLPMEIGWVLRKQWRWMKFITTAFGVKIQEMVPWHRCVIWNVDCLTSNESGVKHAVALCCFGKEIWLLLSCNYMTWFKTTIHLRPWIVPCPKESGFKSQEFLQVALISLRYSICRSSDTCQETQWGKVFLWTVKCLRRRGSHEQIIKYIYI